MKKSVCSFILAISIVWALLSYGMIKQRYGGNLKVAEDLVSGLQKIQLFRLDKDRLTGIFPLLYQIENDTVSIDFTSLPDDQISEIEKSILAIEESSNECHWILNYPALDEERLNSISVESGRMIVRVSEPDFLNTILLSSCIAPAELQRLHCFRNTQFGFEANGFCLGGRPFLDSITPVTVDPTNPYLSFKLGEVDVFPVPEEKFQQISADAELRIIAGPEIFLFLKTRGLSPEEIVFLKRNINVRELAQSVLNHHAEVLPENVPNDTPSQPFTRPVHLIIPTENPYRLLGERIKIHLQDAGIKMVEAAPAGISPLVVELIAKPVDEYTDLFRYRLLREDFNIKSNDSWFEVWDELQAAGKLLPLMIHQSRIAVRKNVFDVQMQTNGAPDFSNAWIEKAP